MDEALNLLLDFELGQKSESDLVNWAIIQLENGNETKEVLELAGLYRTEFDKSYPLFKRALMASGIEIPNELERGFLSASIIAQEIINGSWDVNTGCSILADISMRFDSPEELSIFELLAHEQYDHENIGITSENIKPEIIEAAKKLLSKLDKS